MANEFEISDDQWARLKKAMTEQEPADGLDTLRVMLDIGSCGWKSAMQKVDAQEHSMFGPNVAILTPTWKLRHDEIEMSLSKYWAGAERNEYQLGSVRDVPCDKK